MTWIDTHAHLTDEKLRNDLDEILCRSRDRGVRSVITVATNVTNSIAAIELASRYPGVFPSVGIHPNEAQYAEREDWSSIESLAKLREVVAIGETGLDKYWDDCPWDIQVDYFHRHIALGRSLDLPLIIHMRDCALDMLDELKRASQAGSFRGVMHSFTADEATASTCLDIGLYISFAGMLTYKKSNALRSVARMIPLDRILVETDSPYLSPEPVRGRGPNEPANVAYTAEFLANLLGVSQVEFSQVTTENALRLFNRIDPNKVL